MSITELLVVAGDHPCSGIKAKVIQLPQLLTVRQLRSTHHLKRNKAKAITTSDPTAQCCSRSALLMVKAIQLTTHLEHALRRHDQRDAFNEHCNMEGVLARACPSLSQHAIEVTQRQGATIHLWGDGEATSRCRTDVCKPVIKVIVAKAEQLVAATRHPQHGMVRLCGT